jgi:transcriptional accessory protein Tex/SPT6
VDLKRKRIALSMRKGEAPPHRAVAASNAASSATTNMHPQPPHQAKPVPEGALAAALNKALQRK